MFCRCATVADLDIDQEFENSGLRLALQIEDVAAVATYHARENRKGTGRILHSNTHAGDEIS